MKTPYLSYCLAAMLCPLMCFWGTAGLLAQTVDYFEVTSSSSDTADLNALPKAIFKAYKSQADSVVISFNIPGPGPHYIYLDDPKFDSLGDPDNDIDEHNVLYRDNLLIDGSTQSGYSYLSPKVIITRAGELDSIGLFVRGNNTSIKGLQFENFEQCINVWNANELQFLDNVIVRDTVYLNHTGSPEYSHGLAIWGSSSTSEDILIKGNLITGFHRGIHLRSVNSASLRDNCIYENDRGIGIQGCNAVTVENNKFGTDFGETQALGNFLSSIKIEEACENLDIHGNVFIGPPPADPRTAQDNSAILFDYNTGAYMGDSPPRKIAIYGNCFGSSQCFSGDAPNQDAGPMQAHHYGLKISQGSNFRIGSSFDDQGSPISNQVQNHFNNHYIAIHTANPIDSLLIVNSVFHCNQAAVDLEDGFSPTAPQRPVIEELTYFPEYSSILLSGSSSPNTTVQIFAHHPYWCEIGQEQANELMFSVEANSNGLWQYSYAAEAFPKQYLASAHKLEINASSKFSDPYEYVDCDSEELCIWPGDCNADGIVDLEDWLSLGQQFGSTGPARINGNSLWQSQAATSWLENGPANAAHADADGDGQIGFSDTSAVIANMGQRHFPQITSSSDQLPASLSAEIQNTIVENEIVDIAIMLNAEQQIEIYGLAFKVQILLADSSELAQVDMPSDVAFADYEGSLLGVVDQDMIVYDQMSEDLEGKTENSSRLWSLAGTRIDRNRIFTPGGLYCSLYCIMEVGDIAKNRLHAKTRAATLLLSDIVISDGTGQQYKLPDSSFDFDLYSPGLGCQDLNPATTQSVSIHNLNGQEIFASTSIGKLPDSDYQTFEQVKSNLQAGIYLLYHRDIDGCEQMQKVFLH